jgi:hypothetical protein
MDACAAPLCFDPEEIVPIRLVKECVTGGWLDDIPANLGALAIDELLAVADHVEGLVVTVGVPDVFRWNWGAKETYFVKSCYLAMFHGIVAITGTDEVQPRQCPCLRAFDSWSALGDPANSTAIRRKQRDTGFYLGSAPLVG